MNFYDLKDIWKKKNDSEKSPVNLWDDKADYFGNYRLEDALNDKLVKIIKENNLIDKESMILDVGCGVGKHCIALADDCFKAIGTDLSPKMIEYARQKALQYNKHNLEFRCDDWSKLDIKEEGLYKNFDLVIACMTPAISSYETFAKFMDCSRRAGIYCTSTKKTDSVIDGIDALLGIEKKSDESERSLTYAFSILWDMGYCPRVEYIEQTLDNQIQIDKAFNVYASKIKVKYGMNTEQERILNRYIEDISENEMIHGRIETTKAVMHWKI